MARVIVFCLINLFVISCGAFVPEEHTLQDCHYEYSDFQQPHADRIQLELLPDTGHVRGKRQLNTNASPVSNTNVNASNNATPLVPIDPVKSGSPTLKSNVDDASLMANLSQSDTLKDAAQLGKNLGENGTGIRRPALSTPTPITSTPLPPLLHAEPVDTKIAPPADGNNAAMGENNINIDTFSALNINKTLEEHEPEVKEMKEDDHVFYQSKFQVDPKVGQKYWVDIDNMSNVKVNDVLSKSHRRAATVKLSFDFPFYGHLIRNVTVATGGFLYTGEYVHSWLAATQYIAPLMANFDTSLSNDSYIKYVDNGTAFTVQWERVSLQDKPDEGEFTFQATLLSSGDIVFVYRSIPVTIENIQDQHHPVKIGLSDAYIIDRTIFFIRKKTIYEYHRVNFQKEDIKDWTVIYLTALPTCLKLDDCKSCLTAKMSPPCTWCPSLNRCSNGVDRNRQDWLTRNCDKINYKNETECSRPYVPPIDAVEGEHEYATDSEEFRQLHDINRPRGDDGVNHADNHGGEDSSRLSNQPNSGVGSHGAVSSEQTPVSLGVSNVMLLLSLVALVVALGFWIMYAYRNPHTTSGQLLIRYRPSQWKWRRGEARYTAATIHM